MTKLFFRFLFLTLGLFICCKFGNDAVKPIWYRVTGVVVEGRISGFLAGQYNRSVQPDNSGIRGEGHPPVFSYSISPDTADLLTGRSDVGTFFSSYDLGEKVTVVFPKNDPQDAHIFGLQLIGMNALIFLFGVYSIRLGVCGRV